jgi:hypothetical protein
MRYILFLTVTLLLGCSSPNKTVANQVGEATAKIDGIAAQLTNISCSLDALGRVEVEGDISDGSTTYTLFAIGNPGEQPVNEQTKSKAVVQLADKSGAVWTSAGSNSTSNLLTIGATGLNKVTAQLEGNGRKELSAAWTC